MFVDLIEKGLSLERLLNFLQVARSGGISKAANRDAIKQSQYSRQISDLERYFGVTLLKRDGAQKGLTPAGERLCALLNLTFRGLGDFKNWCAETPEELTLGAGESVLRWMIFPRLVELRTKLPKVSLTFLNLRSAEIVHRLCQNELDLGVVRKDAVSASLRYVGFGRLEYALFVPKALLPEGQSVKDAKLLERVPLALLEGEGRYASVIRRYFARKPMTGSPRLACSSLPQIAAVLNTGTHAAFLPRSAQADVALERFWIVDHPLAKMLGQELVLAWNPRACEVRQGIQKVLQALQGASA